MVMCIFLFLLWLILNGKVTLEICLFGVVVTGAVYAFCVAALGCRPQAERRFLKRLGGYVVYGAILVREIIRANLAVMRVIWSRKPDYHPAIVRVHAPAGKARLPDAAVQLHHPDPRHCDGAPGGTGLPGAVPE
ncbi:MAG: Na+/H+ antiporter subunit E [Oscillospiraceae bacterium]